METCCSCSVMLIMGSAVGDTASEEVRAAAAVAAAAAAAADDDDGVNAGCNDSAEAVEERACIARAAS